MTFTIRDRYIGKHFKIDKYSQVIFPIVFSTVLIFYLGYAGYFGDPTTDSLHYPFEVCEAMDFSEPSCRMDYKWTRTYADGNTITQYAEFDPFVNVDPNETKWTKQEQDFLPP